MRSQTKRIRRPLTNEELEFVVDEAQGKEENQISINNVPLEERRKEARKPLYLVRY